MSRKLSSSDIQNIDSSIITCCSYHRNYFQKIQNDAPYFIKMWEHILSQAEKDSDKKKAHLFDFGCGQGLFGIFAKKSGWSSVSMMDMNGHCVENAEKLTEHFKLDDIHIGLGKEEDVADFFKEREKPNVLVSTDVIEHVYSIPKMLSIFKDALPTTTLIFTTGAVAENPLRSKMMKRLQVEDELKGTDVLQTTTDNPYGGLNFREVRKKIIQEADTDNKLSENKVAALAIKTRGQNREDVISSVQKYFTTGKMPIELQHPTNTCDPISSSWTERLLTVKEYKEIFEQNGYKLQVIPGYYNDITNKGVKKISLKLLNIFVQFFKLPQYGAYLMLKATPV